MHFKLKLHTRSRCTCQCRFFIFSTPDLRAFARRVSSLCLCSSAGIRFPVFIQEAVTVSTWRPNARSRSFHLSSFSNACRMHDEDGFVSINLHFCNLKPNWMLYSLYPPHPVKTSAHPAWLTGSMTPSSSSDGNWNGHKASVGEEEALHSVCATVCVKKNPISNGKGLV